MSATSGIATNGVPMFRAIRLHWWMLARTGLFRSLKKVTLDDSGTNAFEIVTNAWKVDCSTRL
jgi:hypothetical protein